MAKRRGRPKKSGREHLYRINLRLREGYDDDLIAFMEQFPPGRRVAAVKTALRTGGMMQQMTFASQENDAEDDLGLDLDDFIFD